MKPIRLIRYKPDYQDTLLQLHHEAIADMVMGISQNDEETDLRNIDKYYIQNGGEFLVGLINEEVVAMGGFQRLSNTTAELRRMRVREDLQGKGYGGQLLSELERIAVESGINFFSFETAKQRPLTLEFYRKYGYAETGEGHYGQIETVHFSKNLQ